MPLQLRHRLLSPSISSLFSLSSPNPQTKPPFSLSLGAAISRNRNSLHTTATKPAAASEVARPVLFVPPGVEPDDVTEDMVLPGSNIVLGPYAGDAKIKQVEFIKSSNRPKDCPKDDRPEFAMLGRSNVGKSSLINILVRKKDLALTSKKPGKTQLINHFLVNKSWYIVDLPGYGFASAPESARMDWSVFTKGYFLNRETLVSVLLLIDASVPPQKIDLDCANWLGRNNDVGRVSVRAVATKVGTDSKADIWTQNLVNTLTFEDVASSDKTDVLSLTFEDVTSLDPKVASSGQKTWKKEMNPKRLNSSASQRKKALQFPVIKYPLGTEAAIKLMLERNTLVFVVDKHADKNDIKDNVKKLFKVRAKKVNTSITPDGTKKAFIMPASEFKASNIAKKIKIL